MNRSFKEIFERYSSAKREGLLISLSQPSTGNVRNRLIEFVDSNRITDEDRKYIVTFLPKNIKNIPLALHIADIDESFFRPISYFLKGKTKKPDTHSVRPVLDILVDFDIRELVSSKKSNVDKESIINDSKHTVSITDIDSGEDTNISIISDVTQISIEKIRSGKNTNLDI